MVVEVIVAEVVVVAIPLPTLHPSVAAGGKDRCLRDGEHHTRGDRIFALHYDVSSRKSFVTWRYPIDLLISVLGFRRHGYWKIGRSCLRAGVTAFISLKEHELWVWQLCAAGLILRL